MHYEKLFPSRFVRASDIEGKDEVHSTMRGVRIEDVHNRDNNQKEQKPILYFFGSTKGLVLNRTNAETIAKLHGPDTEQWAGKRISLYVEQGVRAFGRVWNTVRVKEQVPPSKEGAPVRFIGSVDRGAAAVDTGAPSRGEGTNGRAVDAVANN